MAPVLSHQLFACCHSKCLFRTCRKQQRHNAPKVKVDQSPLLLQDYTLPETNSADQISSQSAPSSAGVAHSQSHPLHSILYRQHSPLWKSAQDRHVATSLSRCPHLTILKRYSRAALHSTKLSPSRPVEIVELESSSHVPITSAQSSTQSSDPCIIHKFVPPLFCPQAVPLPGSDCSYTLDNLTHFHSSLSSASQRTLSSPADCPSASSSSPCLRSNDPLQSRLHRFTTQLDQVTRKLDRIEVAWARTLRSLDDHFLLDPDALQCKPQRETSTSALRHDDAFYPYLRLVDAICYQRERALTRLGRVAIRLRESRTWIRQLLELIKKINRYKRVQFGQVVGLHATLL
ncbi:unnamed protein product, partial [Protopolystoma xenopodis]